MRASGRTGRAGAGRRPGVRAAAPRVRRARRGDLAALVGFARAMARETEGKRLDLATVRAGMAALLRDPTRGSVFVAEVGARVVATLTLTLEWSDWRDGWFWWIQSVYVRPAWRRRGLYRLLHDHVRALAARDPEVYGLRLYVERQNRAARATYEAIGMDETPYRLYEETTRRADPRAARSRRRR